MHRVALVAAICLTATPGSAQDKATIQKLNDQFAQAFNRADLAATAGMYT